MEVNVTPVPEKKARKRSRNENQWKRNQKKQERYAPKHPPNLGKIIGKCSHKKKGVFKCNELNPQDVRKFHAAFFAKQEKRHQDNFILRYLKVKAPVRRRRRVGQRNKSETFTTMYVKTYTKPYRLLRVCQAIFLMILGIGVHRLRSISKRFLTKGELPEDRRGGDRASQKNLAKKLSVMQFIETFKCIVVKSHYCRSSTSERKYMSSELNIKKMWRMYQEAKKDDGHLMVKECYFRNIFNKTYNIGFHAPRVDVCSKCTELSEKIKKEQDETQKVKLMADLRIHKLKAKSFYELLREQKESMITMSFDKFLECKRYYLKRVKNYLQRFLLRGEVHYRVDTGRSKSVMKPQISIEFTK